MRTLLLLLTLLTASTARNEFPNEVMVTSADVVDNEIKNIGKAGESYRLYATCAVFTYAHNQTLIDQITITDSKGKVYRLNEFHTLAESSYFLSEDRIVLGPLTVHDPTSAFAPQPGMPARLAYTIYIVTTKVPAMPVAVAVEWTNLLSVDSNSYNGQEVRGVTILSAEAFFTLRQFNITADSAYIIPRGYDYLSDDTPFASTSSILNFNKDNAERVFTTVFGPIATIINNDVQTGRIMLTYDIVTYWASLTSGSSISLLSPNWLSLDDSYSTSWDSYAYALDRTVNYEKNTYLEYSISASSVKDGEAITVEIKNEHGETNDQTFGPSAQETISSSIYGCSFRLIVNVTDSANLSTYPRFIVKITSGASANLFIVSLLLVSLYYF